MTPDDNERNKKEDDISKISKEKKEVLKREFLSSPHFYQPAYRYEEPFWKAEQFLNDEKFQDNVHFDENFVKKIEIITSTKENKRYLLDLVLDFTIDQRNLPDRKKWDQINTILNKIKKKSNIRFGIGPRHGGYRVSIVELNPDLSVKETLLPSIDNLSLGESILLNFVINIIRNSDNPPKELYEMQGIVIIDEVDVHLHTDLQYSVLPELVKLFPKIQFIFTTHSPIFLLGMKKIFGESGFEIRNMPNGEVITAERFSEFETAYSSLSKTEKFENGIKKFISDSKKPVLFVEGILDIKYINKSAELLDKKEILNEIEIHDGDGFGGLDKIWKHYNTKLSKVSTQKILLLYDCDTEKKDDENGRISKKIIPSVGDNLIKKGIENLFPENTIQKAKKHKSAFIDKISEHSYEKRGEDKIIPEKYEINEDEKSNLCNWICENGSPEDFLYFKEIFSIIEEVLLKNNPDNNKI